MDFTIGGVDKFLQENPSLEFYAFAYDCTVSEGEIRLCFNTESDHQRTVDRYRNGKNGHRYQSDEAATRLRYNTGDWEYAFFESLDLWTEEEKDDIFTGSIDENYEAWDAVTDDLCEIFCECLIDFTRSETYKKIPKTSDFAVFCFDHDEHPGDSNERLEKVRSRYV